MDFPYPVLHGLQDAEQNFETLQDRDILDLDSESVLQTVNTGPFKVAWGTVTLTWSASTSSGGVNVNHGLGATPGFVGLQAQSVGFAAGVVVMDKVTATSGTTFTANAEASASVTGSVTFYWLAVG